MNKKKIFVTGADGFIGSHLCEKLVKDGHKVTALVQYNSFNTWGWLDNIPKKIQKEIDICSGDIRDSYGMRKFVKSNEIVFHLAALIAIPFSYHHPNMYIDTNVKGTLNLLQACKEFDIDQFIHTSTSEVYGTAQFIPINESHPLVGQSPYSASKIAADQLAYSFYSAFNLPVSIIRPFNTYGPRQSARAIIPTIISQILNNKKNIKLGSTNPTRDFTYIDDTVNGFTSFINCKNTIGKTINIGSNFETSILDVVQIVSDIVGTKISVITDNKRIRPKKSEVNQLLADNSVAKQILNWHPKFYGAKGLKKGLKYTIEWMSKEENIMKYKSGIYNI